MVCEIRIPFDFSADVFFASEKCMYLQRKI